MNVLVLNPPFHPRYSRSQRSPAVIKSDVIYYPIWLAYATGVLEQDGFDVKFVDAPAADYNLQRVLDLAEEFHPRLVVLDTSTPSIHNDVQVAEAIKSQVPNTFTILVGSHVSALPEASLRPSPAIDAVARWEYDYTVRDLARLLDGGGDVSAILGLSYQNSDGTIIHNRAHIKLGGENSTTPDNEVYFLSAPTLSRKEYLFRCRVSEQVYPKLTVCCKRRSLLSGTRLR
jgi:anaerobic magnesium-protoporphyrin IX monomethyl ester cyclase